MNFIAVLLPKMKIMVAPYLNSAIKWQQLIVASSVFILAKKQVLPCLGKRVVKLSNKGRRVVANGDICFATNPKILCT